MPSTKQKHAKRKRTNSAENRSDRREWLERFVEPLMEDIRAAHRLPRYRNEKGETVEGVLLNASECESLLKWWDETRGRTRGRPERLPSLFDDNYREEFDRERQRIIAARGKQRGATKEATATLAVRHGVSFDAMRKRLKRK